MQLTLPELNAARSFLVQARMLVQGVSSLFFNVSDTATAARLNDIVTRLADETAHVERLISNASSGGQP